MTSTSPSTHHDLPEACLNWYTSYPFLAHHATVGWVFPHPHSRKRFHQSTHRTLRAFGITPANEAIAERNQEPLS